MLTMSNKEQVGIISLLVSDHHKHTHAVPLCFCKWQYPRILSLKAQSKQHSLCGLYIFWDGLLRHLPFPITAGGTEQSCSNLTGISGLGVVCLVRNEIGELNVTQINIFTTNPSINLWLELRTSYRSHLGYVTKLICWPTKAAVGTLSCGTLRSRELQPLMFESKQFVELPKRVYQQKVTQKHIV